MPDRRERVNRQLPPVSAEFVGFGSARGQRAAVARRSMPGGGCGEARAPLFKPASEAAVLSRGTWDVLGRAQ